MSCGKFTAQFQPLGFRVTKFRIFSAEREVRELQKCFSKVTENKLIANLCNFDVQKKKAFAVGSSVIVSNCHFCMTREETQPWLSVIAAFREGYKHQTVARKAQAPK